MKRRYQTGDQNWVRQRNLAIVLNYLWEAGQPVSRSYLVEVSGLNKSTVGSLLAQLQLWGFVTETGKSEPRPGRPGTLVDINPEGGRLIGAEIGVDFISVIVTDLKTQTIWRQKVETDSQLPLSQAQILEQAEQLVHKAIEATASENRLLGIGIGVPALIDHATGTIIFAPNLKWSNVPLRDKWQEHFGVPVVVENDANAAALGEQMLGAAKQVDNFVYLNAGVGLGSGLIIGGKLYGGAGGFAGEVGHMTLEPDGPPCNCGNRGCWETLVGPVAIVRQVRQAAAQGATPKLMELGEVNGKVNAIRLEHVLHAAAQGEPAVLEVLNEVGRYLGMGIANLVNTFNPSLVVLGGVLSLAGPYILPRAQQEVDARTLAAVRERLQIIWSAFKFDSCAIGAVTLILREILNNPTLWQSRGNTSISPSSPAERDNFYNFVQRERAI
jgi:glucokinase-like ROK family protein